MKTFTKMLLTVMCLFALVGVQAQAVSLCNEKFSSKTPQGWSIQPASTAAVPTWTPDKSLCVSANYSMHGYVPFNSGDTAELVTPYFDCSQYKYVMVQFSHICKILPSDICEVMYQEQGLGTYYQWRPLPADAYRGKSATYARTLVFDHNSYSEWKGQDTFATPSADWWKEESFDVSNYASYTKIRFKFIIRKGAYYGSFIANGWYVDDFKVMASNTLIKNPAVEFISQFNDTVYSTGPFAIKAKVASRSNTPIRKPQLVYSVTYQKQTTQKAVQMTAVEGDSIWTATIPQQFYGSVISYSIDAADSVGNTARAADGFVLKRKPGLLMTGYSYYQPNDTAAVQYTSSYVPLYTTNTNPAYSRMLYLASEINPSGKNLSIATLAWHNQNYNITANRNIKVWLLATTATTTSGAMAPAANNATLVYDGTTTTKIGWNEIQLDAPFILPAGQNLMVFIENNGGNGSGYIYWSCHYQASRCVYSTNLSTYTSTSYIPLMRFGLGKALHYDSNSVAMVGIDQPRLGATAGTQSVKVTLQNKGLVNLKSAVINWSVNGVLQTPVTWTGDLSCDFNASMTLGTYTQRANQYDTLCAWVNMPNSIVDSVRDDDTATAVIYGCNAPLKGTYTIGNASSDFLTLESALNVLQACGIQSDVTFKLASGKYAVNAMVNGIGSNFGNFRCTFTSAAANADSVVIAPASGTALTLKNSKSLSFTHITIGNTTASSRRVEFTGSCSDIEFKYCKIIGYDEEELYSSTQANIYTSGASLYDIRFIGNSILHGSFAFYVEGSVSDRVRNMLIDSNTIMPDGQYSMDFYCTDRLSFTHNRFEPGESSLYYWANGFDNCLRALIDGNRIYSALNGDDDEMEEQFALILSGSDSCTVSNNEILLIGSVYSTNCGIQFDGKGQGNAIVNNSVFASGCEGEAYAFYLDASTSTSSSTIRNNIFIANGSSYTYPLYMYSNTGINSFDIDYNCWGNSDGPLMYGYINNTWITYSNLADLQNIIPSAVHDIAYSPSFTSLTSDLHPKNYLNLECPRYGNIIWDKDGKLRSGMTHRGCYSDVPPQFNASLLSIVGWSETSHQGDTLRPSVVLQNAGLDTLTSARIGFDLNGVAGAPLTWTGILSTAQTDTVPLGSFILKSGYNTLNVYVQNANGKKDSISLDDTAHATTYSCSAYFTGNHNVGDTCEFQNLDDAINAILRCGMSGPVTLRIMPGTYQTCTLIGNLPGLSDTNNLTITSFTGMNDVILKRTDPGTANLAPIMIEDASHITLSHLTFDATVEDADANCAFAHGLMLTGNTRDIEAFDCKVIMPQKDGATYTAPASHSAFYLYGRTVNDVRLHDNSVDGGATGFYVYGSASTSRLRNVQIEDNDIRNVDYSGIYMMYTDSILVSGNRVSQRSGNFISPNMNVVYAYYTNANIVNNRLNVNTMNAGLYLYYFGDTASHFSQVFNNEVIGKIGSESGCGIYAYGATQAHIYHNSLYLDGSLRSAYGAYLNGNNNTVFIGFRNNLISMNNTDFNNCPIYITGGAVMGMSIGHNNYYNAYTKSPIIGYANDLISDWALWKKEMPQDSASVAVLPEFLNPANDLRLIDTIGISCPMLPDVPADINDSLRSSSTVMGANNFYRSQLNLVMKAIVNPIGSGKTSAKEALTVILVNKGLSNVTSAKLGYRLNGTNGAEYAWTGNMATGATDTVTIANIQAIGGTNRLSAFICSVNGKSDDNRTDDTVSTDFYGCDGPLAGTYTVGGQNPDFVSIDEALKTIDYCGLGGHVIFKIADGTYSGLALENINYTSDNATITFTSASADREKVIFKGPNGLLLKDCYYLTFADLTFEGEIMGVNLQGINHYDHFRHCNITIPANISSPGYYGVGFLNTAGSTAYMQGLTFTGCNVSGGYANFYITYANGGAGGITAPRTRIDSCTLSGAYRYGIYSYYYNAFNSIDYNTITNGSLADEFTGIYTSSYTIVNEILSNRFYIDCPGTAYAMYAYNRQNASADNAGTRMINNNEIIVKGKGSKYGIYMTSSGGNASATNNSILVNGTATSYAIYQSSSNMAMYNNILAGSNANSIPLYANPATGYGDRDYNDYSANGSILANIGGITCANITAVKNASASLDKHSLGQSISWTDTASLRLTNSKAFACPVQNGVTTDIEGQPRYYQTAMGCYDLVSDSTDAALTAFVGTESITSTGTHKVSVVLKNFGQQPLRSAIITLAINGILQSPVAYSPSTPLPVRGIDTVSLGAYAFPIGKCELKAFVMQVGDINHTNDTISTEKFICGTMAGGTYIIGNSANADYTFSNYTDLFRLMDSCGILSDVTLAFESGTYTIPASVKFNTDPLQGHKLTITSQAGNADSVIFSCSLAAISNDGVFVLKNNKNITFRDITVNSPNRNIFFVSGPNENISVLHCKLLQSKTTTSTYTVHFTMGSSQPSDAKIFNQKHFHIIGNYIEGGYGIMRFYGTAADHADYLYIDSNEIHDHYNTGFYCYFAYHLRFNYNRIYVRSGSNGNIFETDGIEQVDSICGNHMDLSKCGTGNSACAIYAVNKNATTYPALFANNVILTSGRTGNYTATWYLAGKLIIAHNSFYATGTAAKAILRLNKTWTDAKIYGNIFSSPLNQYALEITDEGLGGKLSFDYNNYDCPAGVAMWNTAASNGSGGTKLSTLSAMQLSMAGDAHSVIAPMSYIDPTQDLRLTDYTPVLMPSLGQVTDDIYGNTRGALTAMGAYEPSFQKLDASLNDFANTKLTGGQASPVYVTLMNVGTDTLKTADIDWTVNGVQQTKVKWTGSLPVGGTDIVSLGNATAAAGTITRIVAWVSNPNNSTDSKPGNDTASMSEYVCNGALAGTYTVGGSNADFADMDEALLTLNTCGISAPVVLKLRSATFGATTIEGSVKGASRTNTVTVMPDAGATVVFDGGSAAASLTVKNIAHWVFKNLTFGNTANGLTGVLMQENLEDVTFRDCDILASITATSNTYRTISYPNTSGSSKYPVDVRFIHNNIRGGYYNFYLYYTAGTSGAMAMASLQIDSNTLSDAYYYGIYTYYYNVIKSLCYNTVTNRSNSATFYGVYSYYYAYWNRIEGNRLHLTGTSTNYGFYLYYYNQYASYTGSSKAYLVNNEVSLRSNAGTKYGIYLYYPYGFWEVHHNSVYVKSSGTKYGMYLYNSSTAYKINATRNLVMCDSTGTNYPLYISSATYGAKTYGMRELNNLYSSTNVAYVGGAKANIAALQSATAQDSFSLSIKPSYMDVTRDLRLNDYTAFACTRVNEALMDIDGKYRGGGTAIGCYGSKMYDGINMEVSEFVSPKAITDVICYTDYTPVEIAVKNSGMKNAYFDSSALKVSMDVSGVITYHMDTVISSGMLRSSFTDTIRLGNIPTMASGIYNIRITLSDTADHRNDDDTLSLVYNAYRVELPYDINFSTQPKEFVNAIKSGNTGWQVVQGAGQHPVIAPAFGTGRLEFAGAGEPGAFANAIFNAVNIRGCIRPKLSFWYAHAETDKRDMMIVLVTSDGGATYKEIGRVVAADTADYWKRYDFDLTPFSNTQCLSVVFQAISFGGVNQSIDRILISAETDVELSLLPIDQSNRIACDNTPVEVKAVLTNNSPTNILLVNDTLTFNVTGADTKTGKFVYNGQINGYASDTVTVGQFDMSANGNYYLELYMQSQDDNTANDTLRDSTLWVSQDIALKAIQGMDAQTFKKTGDTVYLSAVIFNTGNITVDRFTVRMEINGETVLTDTVNAALKSSDSMVHAMSMPYIVPTATKDQPYYVVGLTAAIACDADEDDNTIEIVAPVDIPDTTDVQVLDITATTPAMGKTKLSPTVRVANVGNTAAYSVNIHVTVLDSAGNAVDSISGIVNEIQPGTNTDYLFSMTYKVPNYTGSYTLKACVEKYLTDNDQSNDTLSKVFGCTLDDTRIGESETCNWSMGQNIPNPAANVTRIPFELPASGNVVFSVMSANGQLIYREEISAEAGSNSVSFDASDIAGGIYYYSMEYQGQRIVRKMNIVR